MSLLAALSIVLAWAGGLQDPTVGIIDFYGLHRVTEAQLRKVLPLKEGDTLSVPSEVVKARLEKVPGVLRATISGVCCDEGKVVLYIGIEEPGAPSFHYRAAPKGSQRLPKELADADAEFERAMTDAVRRGESAEEAPTGHSLMRDPAARAVQQRFVGLAAKHLVTLREVLRNSAYDDDRAVAALVLPYTEDKKAIVPDLVEAIRDPSEDVRNNAMRGLWVMAGYAQRTVGVDFGIPWDPFVDMLNSPDWTDRNKSSMALMELSEKRDPGLIKALRERALPSLVEMARWKSEGHAVAAFWLLGRVAGMDEKDLQAAWKKGDRDAVIRAATADAKHEAGSGRR